VSFSNAYRFLIELEPGEKNPGFNSVPFEDRATFEDLRFHFALTPDDTLVQIREMASANFQNQRLVCILPVTPDGTLSLGGPPHEVLESTLTPVDVKDPHWLSKARTWRAQQRGDALATDLPAAFPSTASKPRF